MRLQERGERCPTCGDRLEIVVRDVPRWDGTSKRRERASCPNGCFIDGDIACGTCDPNVESEDF